MTKGITNQRITETPIAIIDFETTGLTAGYDRVVEVSVVRIDPGQAPRLAFDSLVNPCRQMAATEVHGITDADVAKAPTFSDIAGEVVAATSGCVIAAYNVYFDVQFLDFELGNAGVDHTPPHFCLMYLRPMLGLGARCKLEEACKQHGVDRAVSHIASADAMASADLFLRYLAEIDAQGIVTFGDLARLRKYKFVESFDLAPLPAESTFGLQRFSTNASRAASAAAQPPTLTPAAAYWDLLKSVLVDLEVTDQEVAAIESEKDRSGISPEEVRVLHARAFTSVISQFAADKLINDREQGRLRRLYECLTRLGWAPGQ